MSASAWSAAQRVTPAKPCPVCGKVDWCGFSSDGRFVFCQRSLQWGTSPAIRHTDAGWMYALDPGDLSVPTSNQGPAVGPRRKPPLPRRLLNDVYRSLAARAGLDEAAYQDIVVRRRFSAALETGVYFSLPRAGQANEELSEAVIAEFGIEVVAQVPGFTVHCKACSGSGSTQSNGDCVACGGSGRVRPRFRSVRGDRSDYVVIACDEEGLGFWGYSRRLPYSPNRGQAKYVLLSSSRSGDPTVAGLPKYHVAGRGYPADEVVITEGVIKAEITAWKLRQRVIGVYSTAVDDPTLESVCRVLTEWGR